MTTFSRRSIIRYMGGLVAAPAVIKVERLMKVVKVPEAPKPDFVTLTWSEVEGAVAYNVYAAPLSIDTLEAFAEIDRRIALLHTQRKSLAERIARDMEFARQCARSLLEPHKIGVQLNPSDWPAEAYGRATREAAADRVPASEGSAEARLCLPPYRTA